MSKTQWFNPPFSVQEVSAPFNIYNGFGVVVARAIDGDTAEGIARALNALHRLDPDWETDR